MDVEIWRCFDAEIKWFTNTSLVKMPEGNVVSQIAKVSNVLLLQYSALSGAVSFMRSPPLNHYLSSDPMRKASIP